MTLFVATLFLQGEAGGGEDGKEFVEAEAGDAGARVDRTDFVVADVAVVVDVDYFSVQGHLPAFAAVGFVRSEVQAVVGGQAEEVAGFGKAVLGFVAGYVSSYWEAGAVTPTGT